jgi:hypothetical protein
MCVCIYIRQSSDRGGLAISPEICDEQSSNGAGYLLPYPLPFHTGIKDLVVAGEPRGYTVAPPHESNNKKQRGK